MRITIAAFFLAALAACADAGARTPPPCPDLVVLWEGTVTPPEACETGPCEPFMAALTASPTDPTYWRIEYPDGAFMLMFEENTTAYVLPTTRFAIAQLDGAWTLLAMGRAPDDPTSFMTRVIDGITATCP